MTKQHDNTNDGDVPFMLAMVDLLEGFYLDGTVLPAGTTDKTLNAAIRAGFVYFNEPQGAYLLTTAGYDYLSRWAW